MGALLPTGLALFVALTASSPALAEGADVFVFGGPSIAPAGTTLTPEPTSCALCSRSGSSAARDAPAPLVMLGAGLVGTEGVLRGGAEVLTIFTPGRDTAGYSAFVTYGGIDGGRLFVQTGLGIGSYWGSTAGKDRLERIAGIAHLELGLRITDGFSVIGRGDFLLGREESNIVGTLGLQWVPDVFNKYL